MEASNKSHPSLPANYVTILDLRERWMQQQNQKKRDEDNGNKEPQLNFEVQDVLAADGEDEGDGDSNNKLEQQNPQSEKSLLRSNSNPRSSTRRPSQGSRRPTDTGSCRWVHVSQPKPALPVRNRQPKPPPVVQVAEAKALPVIRVSQSKKPPALDSPKVECEVESCGDIMSSDKMEKGKKKKKKKPKRNKKQNDEKKDAVQLQPEKCGKENPEQGIEVGRGNNDVDDDSRAETDGKLAGLSLSSGVGECCGGKSMAVRNRCGFRKKEGGYGRFEGRAMLKEKAKRESGLVWVKKGEAS